MEVIKFILKNYFEALVVLLAVIGVTLWLRPERALELIETLLSMTYWDRLFSLLVFNLMWSIFFILFDLWNIARSKEH